MASRRSRIEHDTLGELRWLLFSDRGLYRPGEQARLKGWIRRAGRRITL